jgi:hypothetical protein
MKNAAVLSRTFPARISATEVLIESVATRTDNAPQLRQAADALDRVGPLYGRASTAEIYAAFAELLRTVALLIEWRTAVLTAQADAERFLRAAKAQYQLWLTEYGKVEAAAALVRASAGIDAVKSIEEVGAVCGAIARTPLPLGVFADDSGVPRSRAPQESEKQEKAEPSELAVAFLRFVIDGVPAAETHFLTPGEAHDLEVEVRVSRWPEQASALRLTPVTIEPKSSYDFPDFTFARPSGDPPFRMEQRQRAMLRVPQGLQARPFEFKYAAAFEPTGPEEPAVVGQRSLRIEGIDIRRAAMTGYPGIDAKILKVRDHLRSEALINAADLNNVLTVLIPLASLAARTLQDALFKEAAGEAYFQSEVRNELRRIPTIASELEEHAQAGGGITDLSFRGIRIELKFEPKKTLALADCTAFAEQTVSYVVATGKRVGILCVLDCSPKTAAAFPADAGIDVLIVNPTKQAPVYVVVILIQGNLARPSDLSR